MILRFSAFTLLALLLVESIAAWVSPSGLVLPRNALLQKKSSTLLFSSLPEDEDELCGDEEECEIDWSQMPDFDEEERQLEAEEASLKAALSQLEQNFELECLPDIKRQKQHVASMNKVRLRLEMNWKVEEAKDECDVQRVQTCAHACQDCGGTGFTECRFCKGTAVLRMTSTSFRPCSICQQGVEICRNCKGSGWVAGWTELQELAP